MDQHFGFSELAKQASLQPKEALLEKRNSNHILYIGVPFMVKMHHYSSAWGFSGENVPRFLEFITQFFSALETVTQGEISYRPYPPQNLNHILIYNKEGILKNFVSSFREFTDTRESSKFQMQQSSLVVIDYISTSYLECLHMNIPFILFWDKDSYFLKEEFYDKSNILCLVLFAILLYSTIEMKTAGGQISKSMALH